MLRASSSIAATIYPSIFYETRCRKLSIAPILEVYVPGAKLSSLGITRYTSQPNKFTDCFSYASAPRYYQAVLSPEVSSPPVPDSSLTMVCVISLAGWEPSGAE